jgi:hypothetical protein
VHDLARRNCRLQEEREINEDRGISYGRKR